MTRCKIIIVDPALKTQNVKCVYKKGIPGYRHTETVGGRCFEFGIAKYPSKSHWTVYELSTGFQASTRGDLKTREQAVQNVRENLLKLAYLFKMADNDPAHFINTARRAMNEYQKANCFT